MSTKTAEAVEVLLAHSAKMLTVAPLGGICPPIKVEVSEAFLATPSRVYNEGRILKIGAEAYVFLNSLSLFLYITAYLGEIIED